MLKKNNERQNCFCPSLLFRLETKVNILPSVLTLLAEAVVAAFQLDNLQFVLLLSNLSWCQNAKLAAESYKGLGVSVVSEDARAELFACLTVDKLTYLHLRTKDSCK